MTERINLSPSARRYSWVSLTLLALSLVFALAFIWLWILNLGTEATAAFGNRSTPLVLMASGVVFSTVGWLISSRRPENKIGWIALGIGVSTAGSGFALEYAVYAILTAPGALPGSDVAAWIANFLWVVPFGLLGTVLPLLYPSGQLPSPRWRAVYVGAVAGLLGAIIFFALMPGPLVSITWVENRFGLPTSESWVEIFSLGFFLLAAMVPFSAWSLRTRYRRGDDVVRAQIKWFAAAAAVVAVTYVGQLAVSLISDSLEGGSESQRLFQTVVAAGFGGMGLAIGIAVLRYRLYEIDRLISRTISYSLLVGVLGGTFFGIVALLALFVPSDDPWVVAVATLAVFASFNPLRSILQSAVDRRFNRSQFDAERVVDQFARALRDSVESSEVIEAWTGVVSSTLQPSTVGVWVRDL